MCVGKDKRIYENDAKCTCYDYQLWDNTKKKNLHRCEARSNYINTNGVCIFTFSTGDMHLNSLAIRITPPSAMHLVYAELAYTSCCITHS